LPFVVGKEMLLESKAKRKMQSAKPEPPEAGRRRKFAFRLAAAPIGIRAKQWRGSLSRFFFAASGRRRAGKLLSNCKGGCGGVFFV
jgi:hypothetical protein